MVLIQWLKPGYNHLVLTIWLLLAHPAEKRSQLLVSVCGGPAEALEKASSSAAWNWLLFALFCRASQLSLRLVVPERLGRGRSFQAMIETMSRWSVEHSACLIA